MSRTITSLLYFLFILKIPTVVSQSEMRKTIKIEKRGFPMDWDIGVKSYFDPGDEKEVTICLRFRTFSYNEGFGWPFHIVNYCPDDDCVDKFGWNYGIGWKTGLEDENKQAGGTFLWFSHDNQTDREINFQGAEKTRWHFNLYEDWLYPFDWQSVCYSWSVIKNFELVYVNGKFVQGYEWSLQLKKGWGDEPKEMRIAINWRGEITDLNIYASAFDKEKMKRWTTSCESPAPGDILGWHPETYNITDTNATSAIISQIAAKDLCSAQGAEKVVLEMFDDKELKSPAMSENHCARLNGRLNLIPNSDEEALPFAKEFEDYAVKANLSAFTFWVGGQAYINGTEMLDSKEGYQVYPKGGLWVIEDPVTGDIIGKPPVMTPTGHTFAKLTQECVACGATYNKETSISSDEKFCKRRGDCIYSFGCFSQKCDSAVFNWGLMCKFNQKLKLRLKGLCKEHKVDTEYFLLGYEVLEQGGGHRRKYGGSMGWLLAHDKERDVWLLEHHHYPHLTLTMEDKDSLPVGLHSWKVENNTCNLGQTNR